MSAYAAGRPLGKGLLALAQAVEITRQRALAGCRPSRGGQQAGSADRHATPGSPDAAGSGTPPPRPRPSPRPSARPTRPAAHPTPAPREQGTAPTPTVRPSPRPRPSPHPTAPTPQRPPEPVEVGPDGISWRLVERSQTGDAEAFAELYDRYVDMVHRFIYYRVGDRGTAEDFTSETFLRAWRRIGSVTNQGRDIGAWFITIARNIVLDHVKSSRYRLEITTAELLDADQQVGSPESAVLDRLTSVELLRAVKQLNPEQQECIVLRFLEGLSVAETAAAMGKNEGAIKALQHRAVRRLATLLPEDFR